MKKPNLIIITGEPGSGKSTLASKLSTELRLPLISRDELKEGYVDNLGKSHEELPAETNRIVTELFFGTIEQHLHEGAPLIAEAAFQHKVWEHFLSPMMDKCELKFLICKTSLAAERRRIRAENDPRHEYYHGKAEFGEICYDEPRFPCPTLHIDTTEKYSPSLEEIREFITKGE